MKPSKIILIAIVVLVAAFPLLAKKQRKDETTTTPAAGATTVTTTASQADGDVLARVGDETITKAEVDQALASRLMQIRQQEYELRRAAVDQLVMQKLMENEAKARGTDLPALLKAEVEDKVATPSKEEMDQFYERVKGRLGGKTREEANADLERMLRQQKAAERRNAFTEELRAKSNVQILIEPPRVDVTIPADAPVRGPANAPVTIVEFSDYQCPYCKRAHSTVEQLVAQYPNDVRLIFLDYPLPSHTRAAPAAEAARCAHEQGKYWEYQNNLMTVSGDLSDDDLKKRATDLGLDATKFGACLTSDKHVATVQAGFEEGARAGVTGTPTFFVNGRMLVGAKPIEQFKAIIDEEIKRAGGGTRVQGS